MARQGRPPKQPFGGSVSDNRVAWLQMYVGQVIMSVYPEGYRDDDPDTVPSIKAEPGPTLRLNFMNKSRTAQFNLTALTLDELDKFKELLDLAFDLARPVVEERDKAAQVAYDNGDDSFVRIYRQVPRLVVREGALRANSGSLRERPSGVSLGAGAGEPGPGGLRGVGSELAERKPEEGRGQDDEPTAD